jgi:SAM-dependent methyltransferase
MGTNMRNKLGIIILCILFGALSNPTQSTSVSDAGLSSGKSEKARADGSSGEPDVDDFSEYDIITPSGDSEFDLTLGSGEDIDPFGSTPQEVVMEMLAMAGVGKDDVVYDLGSGDGRIPITAAKKFGARGVGFELRPELVEQSRHSATKAGVGHRVKFLTQNFFEADISEATVVTLYLFPRTTLKLRPKLLSELRPGARIIAYDYGIEGWPRDKEQAIKSFSYGTLYYWIVPANVSGSWQGSLLFKVGDYRKLSFEFKQTYQQVTGKASLGELELPLNDIKLQADNLTASLYLPNQERLVLVGKVNGDQIQGVIQRSDKGLLSMPNIWRVVRQQNTKVSIDPGLPGSALTKQYPVTLGRTGQMMVYRRGDDGTHQKGAAAPIPRFTDHSDGTVTDHLTGLMWTKNANVGGRMKWNKAIDHSKAYRLAGHSDWRLPNLHELQSLINYGRSNPALSIGYPFTGVQTANYWSSTASVDQLLMAWSVNLGLGRVIDEDKGNANYVWLVRAGQ